MEFRFAFRSLRLRPGFAVLAICILALGIGANTAIFSVVNSVLLRPLEYRDADRIVLVGNTWKTGRKSAMAQISEADFYDLHEQAKAFDALSGFMGGGNEGSSVLVGNAAEFAGVTRTTDDFFRVMGVEPNLGRTFEPEETQVAVVSDGFWRRRLSSDPKALGSTIRAY